MPCYKPLRAYWSKHRTKRGKRGVTFDSSLAYSDQPLELACGQCVGCRLERSRQWAIRCVHEAQLHEENAFITLTYDAEHLPQNLSLRKRDFQLFLKRLRRRLHPKKVRYFVCGEYGEKNQRPHYHACIFGHDFPDKELWTVRDGVRLYVDQSLSDTWNMGFSTIGDVTFESAAYVARYIMKKVTGKALYEVDRNTGLRPYELIDKETGEVTERHDEYTDMSLKPGIGAEWYDKYRKDVYPSDNIAINGQLVRPPKFYDRLLESEHENMHSEIKHKRRIKANRHKSNNTQDRLAVREKVTNSRIQLLKRDKA